MSTNNATDPNNSASQRRKSPSKFALKVPAPPAVNSEKKNHEGTSESPVQQTLERNDSGEQSIIQESPSSSQFDKNLSSFDKTEDSNDDYDSKDDDKSDGTGSTSDLKSMIDKVNAASRSTTLGSSQSDEEAFKSQTKQAKINTNVTVTGSFMARHLHTAVNYEDFMFVIGGYTGDNALADFSCFHFATRSWSSIENDSAPLVPRYDHTAVVYGDSMFIFAGTNGSAGGLYDDLLEFKFEMQSWQTILGDGNKPSKRRGHTAVVHENSMYVFGGLGADDKPLNDLYEFSFDTLKWQKVATIGALMPSARYHHTSVVFKDSMYVFGGTTDGTHKLTEFFEFKIKNKTWAPINVALTPSARDGHVSVVFQNSMYLCGGGESNNLEIYEFDFDFRKWYRITTPGEVTSPNYFFSAVVRGDCIFFLGGTGPNSKELEYLCLGEDEFEEEFELDEMVKMKNIPKNLWEAVAMKKHPEILELRERLRPLSRLPSYAKQVVSAKTEAKAAMPYTVVLQLIMEYLEHEGFSQVLETIEEESNVKYQRMENKESQLMTLLRIGRRRVRHKDIFGPNIGVVDYDEIDPEVEVVDHLPGRTDAKEEHDINVWDEPGDNAQNINKVKDDATDKMTIASATLNKLIQHLTSEKDKVHDVQFMKTFLFTYQSFTSPEMLLKKLIQRYHVPLPKGMPEDKFKTELQQPVRSRVCNVIKYWVDKCSWDFNEKLLSNLNSFIDGPLSRDGNLSLVKQLRNSITKLHKKKSVSAEDERGYVFGVSPPEPKVPKNIFSHNMNFTQIDEIEIARQLTLIEYDIFSQIVPTELLNRVWNDPDQKHKAPRVLEMLNRFNDIANWVAVNILNTDNKKNLMAMVMKFLRIAENMKSLKNFQTLFAVVTGLNNPLVSRVIQSLIELPPKTKEVINELTSLMSKENNFRTYRELLKYSALPCIPFLEVTLNDIMAIEESHQDYVNGLINFQKRTLLYRAITAIQGYQQRPYNLQPVHQIEVLLDNFPQQDENQLAEMSYRHLPKK